MAKKQATKQPEPSVAQDKKMEQTLAPRPSVAMTKRGFEPATIEEAYRFAQALSESGMVPDNYRGKPRDCLVALDLAARTGASWLAIMQHVYSVHGRTAMDAALVTSLVNQSGLFIDPLEYEVVGDVKDKKNFRIRAYATRRSTGTVLYGPWIDWELVQAEGWDKDKRTRDGNGIIKSKWNTMPEQMFHYRAAAWFQRRHCPEVSMGMLTTEEARDIGPKHVESTVIEKGVNGLKERLAEREQAVNGGNGEGQTETEQEPQQPEPEESQAFEGPEPGDPDERPDEVNDKINEQKEKLQAASSGGKKSNLF
jgi:hypothetical protein